VCQPGHTPATKLSKIKAAFQKSMITDPEEPLVQSPQRPKVSGLLQRESPGSGQSPWSCCLA